MNLCFLKYKFASLKTYFDTFAGVSSRGATPDPIPNSEVKPSCGDGIARETVWESSTTPALFFESSTGNSRAFFLIIDFQLVVSLIFFWWIRLVYSEAAFPNFILRNVLY